MEYEFECYLLSSFEIAAISFFSHLRTFQTSKLERIIYETAYCDYVYEFKKIKIKSSYIWWNIIQPVWNGDCFQ